MAPTVHFIRHAQGYHNISLDNHTMIDPLLTPYGKQQCADLAKVFPFTDKATLLVASPLKRTIDTALLSLPSRTDLTLIALPELQETSDMPCDTGSSKAEIEREFANSGRKLDLSLVTPDWNNKKGRWSPSKPAVVERARAARSWLRNRKESEIVCVTHGGLLHYITEDWTDFNEFAGTGWVNTEYRSYTFDPSSGDNASLVETQESRDRRRGSENPLSEAEQLNLQRVETHEDNEPTQAGSKPEPVTPSATSQIAAKV